MKHFTRLSQVPAQLEAVAAFHQDSQALRLLTPFPVFVQFHEVEPLKEGSVADFTLWFGPLPVRWVAVHSQVDPLTGFTDTQARGPFASWVHRHTFSTGEAGNTLISDEIQATPKRNPFWWLFGQLMWLSLPLLFAYRRHALSKALRKHSSQTYSSTRSHTGDNRII